MAQRTRIASLNVFVDHATTRSMSNQGITGGIARSDASKPLQTGLIGPAIYRGANEKLLVAGVAGEYARDPVLPTRSSQQALWRSTMAESARPIIPPEGLLAGGYREVHPNTPSPAPTGTHLPDAVPDDA